MNTEITCRVFGQNVQKAVDDAKAEILRLENMMSRYIPGSEVSLLNKAAGIKPVRVGTEVCTVLSYAKVLSIVSGGLFDVTIGPLVDLWNYKAASEVPDNAKIRQALRLVNYNDLLSDIRTGTVKLGKPGQSVDLGGIGKGYAGDRLIEIFNEYDIESAFANIGGNVSTLGTKPDGSPWLVGIRHPRNEGSLLGAVSVEGKSVVTSGDYQRYFIDREGMRRHHILDPSTGYPAASGLISATVVADSGMAADALSTLLFVAGIEKGIEVIRGFPDAEAIAVDESLRVYVTRGLKECYKAVTNTEIRFI